MNARELEDVIRIRNWANDMIDAATIPVPLSQPLVWPPSLSERVAELEHKVAGLTQAKQRRVMVWPDGLTGHVTTDGRIGLVNCDADGVTPV